MIAPATLAQRLEATRLLELPLAVEATLKPLFLGITVRTLAGKIDMSDVIEGEAYQPPMIAVTLTRWRAPVAVNGRVDLPVELAAYVVTEETALGATWVTREAVAYALTAGLMDILTDFDTSRWGLTSISEPEEIEARPIFTAQAFAKGVAYYSVTWRQTLLGLGSDPLARMVYTGVESVDDGVTTVWPPDLSEAPV